MSDEPLYCMRCGKEECDHADAWNPPSEAVRYCHTCGAESREGVCAECAECMGPTR